MLLLGGYSYLNTVLTQVYVHYPINAPWYSILLVFIATTVFVWEGNRLLEKFLFRQTTNFKNIHPLLLFFLLSFPVAFLSAFIPTWLVGKVLLRQEWATLALPFQLIIAFGFRANLFLHCINSILYYWRRFQQQQAETEELRKISFQAQMQSLRNQINPHFLFNSLNVLSTLILTSPQIANEFVEEFSKVYRYVLRNYEKELVEVRQELHFIQSYAYLLKKRFGNSIHIDIQVATQYYPYYIVPVALQMLIENAIKHNVISHKKPLHIRIYTNENQTLTVQNTLQKKNVMEEDSTQLGLNNINQRYTFINQHAIDIKQDESTFTVKIPLIKIENAL